MSIFVSGSDRKGHLPPNKCYPCEVPYYSPRVKKQTTRLVPPFSLQSLRQKNVTVQPFEKKNILKPYPVGNTPFRKYYLRGDFPIQMEFDATGHSIAWKTKIENLNYCYYLPMFFTGLCEVEYPYQFFAQQGIQDMLLDPNGVAKAIPVIPQLILPIKNALNTRNRSVLAATLKSLQILVTCHEEVGELLVPYYRQILPPLNLYRTLNVNLGDEIDYGQQKRENIGELVQETLEMLETFGGKDAFINIKYMIPTYESYVRN